MKKTVLMAMMIAAAASTTAYADVPADAASPQTENTANTTTAATPQNDSGNTGQDAANTVPAGEPAVAQPAEGAAAATPETVVGKIDCNLTYPADKKDIAPEVIQRWAEQATLQTFTMQPDQLDQQLAALEKCFTVTGWQGFKNALEKSGNLKAIKEENLNVSALVNGQLAIQDSQDDQWSVVVPVDVTYKNDKTAINQALTVNLTITRKEDGGFGIMQVIAAPKEDLQRAQQPAAQPQPATQAQPATEPAQGAQ
ncbi:MAG: DotI/IcmL family type IV secretion protein [Legionellaceae bacterium]|nr:DotI/IcmL family type IV secretion protein [Legionellaceae bacterium]